LPSDFQTPGLLDLLSDALLQHGLARRLYRGYADSLGLQGNEKVLELGCGSGALSRHIAARVSRGGHLTCLDTSNAWIEVARRRLRRFTNVDLVPADILEADVQDGAFDVAVVHFVLHEIQPEQREKIICTLSRKLKDDGKLFVKEPTKEDHGIPVEQIQQIMAGCGLSELSSTISPLILHGLIYAGVFGKQQ